jgi:hypothetical protein
MKTGFTVSIIVISFRYLHMIIFWDGEQDSCKREIYVQHFWNSYGFHVVIILLPRQSFNSEWFMDSNLVSLMNAFFQLERNSGKRDSSCILTIRILIRQAWLMYFSTNLLWRKYLILLTRQILPIQLLSIREVKGELVRWYFSDGQELFDVIMEILNDMSTSELISVFKAWINKAEQIINGNRKYISWSETSLQQVFLSLVFHI